MPEGLAFTFTNEKAYKCTSWKVRKITSDLAYDCKCVQLHQFTSVQVYKYTSLWAQNKKSILCIQK